MIWVPTVCTEFWPNWLIEKYPNEWWWVIWADLIAAQYITHDESRLSRLTLSLINFIFRVLIALLGNIAESEEFSCLYLFLINLLLLPWTSFFAPSLPSFFPADNTILRINCYSLSLKLGFHWWLGIVSHRLWIEMKERERKKAYKEAIIILLKIYCLNSRTDIQGFQLTKQLSTDNID